MSRRQKGGAGRTPSSSTARTNVDPTATVYCTWQRQPPSANVQSDASPRYQRPSSWRTSTGSGSSYRRHQDVTRSTARTLGARDDSATRLRRAAA